MNTPTPTDEQRPTPRMFPILQWSPIPWEVIAPFEIQAQKNHGQSLQRLSERGGLGECEAVAVLEERKWHRMDEQEARKRLREIVEAHENSPLSQARRTIAALERRNAELAEALRDVMEVFESEIGALDCTAAMGQSFEKATAALAGEKEAK